jgi:hypothetical protein
LKLKRIQESNAETSCPKSFLALSKEYGAKESVLLQEIQDLKLEELDSRKRL